MRRPRDWVRKYMLFRRGVNRFASTESGRPVFEPIAALRRTENRMPQTQETLVALRKISAGPAPPASWFPSCLMPHAWKRAPSWLRTPSIFRSGASRSAKLVQCDFEPRCLLPAPDFQDRPIPIRRPEPAAAGLAGAPALHGKSQ
jgi:hypothetical protein